MKIKDILFFLNKPALVQFKFPLYMATPSGKVETFETDDGPRSYVHPVPASDPGGQPMVSPLIPGMLEMAVSHDENGGIPDCDTLVFVPMNRDGYFVAVDASDISAITVLEATSGSESPKVTLS